MSNDIEPHTAGLTAAARITYIYMTVRQYAEHRQVSRTTVFNWINLGLPSVKQGRLRRIRVEVADAWLDQGSASLAHHVARPAQKRVGGDR
jgi:excisionase family DNA binding protein